MCWSQTLEKWRKKDSLVWPYTRGDLTEANETALKKGVCLCWISKVAEYFYYSTNLGRFNVGTSLSSHVNSDSLTAENP